MAGIGKYYSTLNGESTNIDNSSLYNFKYYRDLILDGKKNSSLMGYAQYIYIVMIQCLIQKSLSMYDTFNPTSIAFESEYNPDGNGFGSSATDGLFRFKYIDKITNQPGFETNSHHLLGLLRPKPLRPQAPQKDCRQIQSASIPNQGLSLNCKKKWLQAAKVP